MTAGRVAVVFRGDPHAPLPPMSTTRLGPVFDALEAAGLAPEAVVYDDDSVAAVRRRLLAADGVLVWVDPVTGAGDRTQLDALLREVAATGVFVSAHPDAILRMGTKEVLYTTRELGWGADTHCYRSVAELEQRFPAVLRAGGPRVLKQYRGNGGIGVQKVELLDDTTPGGDPVVRVQRARLRDEVTEDMPLGALVARCARYFTYSAGEGRLVDQPFQPRIIEGMIRSYLVGREVVGFARQSPEPAPAGADPGAPRRVFGLPSAKTMFDAGEPSLAALRAKVEREWVPALPGLVGLEPSALPVLWDADFLLGPPDAAGRDTYVLCEINVSAVLPFPPAAPDALARATAAALARR